MATAAATAVRTATTAAISAAAASAPVALRPPPPLPTLAAWAVSPPGRHPFGAPLEATLRVATHSPAAVSVWATASYEVDVATATGVPPTCGDGKGGGGGGASHLAASPLSLVGGVGAVHEVALPLGPALSALQRRVSADALCNVGLLRLALVVGPGGAGGGGRGVAAAYGEGGPPAQPGVEGGGLELGGAVAGGGEVVAERSMVVEVFRDQRVGRVGGEDHDLLFRRLFVEA